MTIKQIQQQYLAALKETYGEGEAAAMTTMIFESTGNITKKDLVLNTNMEAENTTEISLKNALYRLLQHEPIQYIIGKA